MLKKDKIILWLMILIGSLSWSLTMIKSGLIYSFGMGFWGPNGHDGLWHIALIESLSKLTFNSPIFSGEPIKNYHLGFDLVLAIVHRLTGINSVNLYFQILPPVLAILIGWLSYKLVYNLTKNRTASLWSVFFVYFSGSWGWVFEFIKSGQMGGESMFWANQAISTLINPPYALSLVVLLAGLIGFKNYLESPKTIYLVTTAGLFGLLFLIKIYAGIIVSFALLLLWLTTLLFRSNYLKRLTLLTVVTGIISLLVFLPFNQQSGSLIILSPLWFPHTMLSFTDRFGWLKLEMARQAYFQSGNWVKWILAEGMGLFIFIFGNIGTRALGFIVLKHVWKIGHIGKLLTFFLLISSVFPLLFIQKGNPWNTIQFFYYFQYFMAIISGIAISLLFQRLHLTIQNSKIIKPILYLFAVLLILTTIPTTASTLWYNYLPSRPPAKISIEELEALNFLRQQKNGVVLTSVFNPSTRKSYTEPRPLFAYETTAYVSAITGMPTFLADEMNLTISNYDFEPRKQNVISLFSTNDAIWVDSFLSDNKIGYIYLIKGERLNIDYTRIRIKQIFTNKGAEIYQVIL